MIQEALTEPKSLNGLVERVTYHNPENGYCVLQVKVRGLRETQAVVGYTSSISEGESIQATGDWSVHRQYGPQFKAQFLKVVLSQILNGYGIRSEIELSNGAIG